MTPVLVRTWLSVGLLAALLGVAPIAQAQLEEPEWEEGDDHPAQLEEGAAAALAAAEAEAEAARAAAEAEVAAARAEAAAAEAEATALMASDPVSEPTPATVPQNETESLRDPARRIEPFLLEIGGIAGLFYQRLSYRDDLFGFMPDYNLSHARELGGYVNVFPLARTDMGILAHIGLEFRYAQMLSVDSQRRDGSLFPTRARELLLGLRYRFACDALLSRGVDASVGVGGGSQVFEIESALALPNVDNRAAVPSRQYRFLRVDAGARVALDLHFFIAMHVGVRIVTSAGDVDGDDWFPRSRRFGLESGLHLGYVLPKDVELSVGFEAQRYMYRLRPQPGDPNIVGGMLDRYARAQVRAGWRF